MNKEQKTETSLIISYMTLRKAIGFLGVALPFAVSLGAMIVFHTPIQGSISGYYYTGTRDMLVGILWVIGFFLLSYKGYGPADNIAGDLGCLFAVGISLFPTAPEVNPTAQARLIGNVHFTFAALFFLTLIFFSFYLFTKTGGKPMTRRKRQRNWIYRGCALLMAACIVLIALDHFLPSGITSPLARYDPIFWLETIAILAFGVSWLVKGETILKDEAVEG